MKGIIWYLKGEFGSFRPFYSTSIIDTYPFPPKTAVVGMIGAALGLSEDEIVDYYKKIRVGIKIEYFESIFNDLVKIWKVEDSGERKIFIVIKRFLYKPRFTIYLATFEETKEQKLLDNIYKALLDPAYPVTLGDSDSLFYPDGKYLKIVDDVIPTRSRIFKCLIRAEVVGGMHYPKDKREEETFKIHPKIVKMPIGFEKGRKPEIINVLVHSKGEIHLKREVEAYEFNGEPVYLF